MSSQSRSRAPGAERTCPQLQPGAAVVPVAAAPAVAPQAGWEGEGEEQPCRGSRSGAKLAVEQWYLLGTEEAVCQSSPGKGVLEEAVCVGSQPAQ